jgi:hypothetical protein
MAIRPAAADEQAANSSDIRPALRNCSRGRRRLLLLTSDERERADITASITTCP